MKSSKSIKKNYKKITDQDILLLFNKYDILSREVICRELGCSIYSVVREIDYLRDEGTVVRQRFGYVLNKKGADCQCLDAKPIMKCSENGVSAYCGNCKKKFK